MPVPAGSVKLLFFTGRTAEIGRGAAHIMDITLKTRILCHLLRFFYNGILASALNNSPLMKGQGAERTGSKTAPAADQSVPHLGNGGNLSLCQYIRMAGPLIRKCIDIIHFHLCQRLCRRILHHIEMLFVTFCQTLAAERVRIPILDPKAFCVEAFIFTHALIVGKEHRIIKVLRVSGTVDGSFNKSQILYLHAAVERICYLHNGSLSHAIGNQIRPAVKKNGSPEAVGPVIIMSQPAQAGFDSAQYNGCFLIGLPDEIAVDDYGTIRALSHDASGGVGIPASVFF